MWGLDTLGIPVGADGSVTLPFWAAASVAALLLVLFVLALIRTGLAGTLVFVALIGFAIWAAVAWSDHEAATQRAALEGRALLLSSAALAPGSALGCMQPTGADAVDAPCERAVFATALSTSAAVTLVAERLALLDQQASFAGRHDQGFDDAFNDLRGTLEQDRFGVVAQVLAKRYGCTPEHCDMLRLLHDPAKVRNNLRDRTFETTLARHSAGWATADASPASTGTTSTVGTAAPIPDRYTLPSAASIPPVSIMSPEPTAKVEPTPKPAAAPKPATAPTPAARRTTHRQTPPAPANPPVQIRPQ